MLLHPRRPSDKHDPDDASAVLRLAGGLTERPHRAATPSGLTERPHRAAAPSGLTERPCLASTQEAHGDAHWGTSTSGARANLLPHSHAGDACKSIPCIFNYNNNNKSKNSVLYDRS